MRWAYLHFLTYIDIKIESCDASCIISCSYEEAKKTKRKN
jgi:hypothetical protein